MSKKLPYFRFTIQQWQNGDISTMPDSCKGVFVDVCAYYWAQDCKVLFSSLSEKFKTKLKTIEKLIKKGPIKVEEGIVYISFLDEQLTEIERNEKFFSEMGKLGQKAKKNKAPLKNDLSYKDKDKDKDKDKEKEKPNLDDLEKFPYLNDEKFKSFFVDHMKGNKASTRTERAINARLKKLHEYTLEESTEALKTSIENGYQGVFPKKKAAPANENRKKEQFNEPSFL